MMVSWLADVVAPPVFAREVVQTRLEALVQSLVDGGERVVELLGTAGADDRRRDDRILEHPRDGHLGHRHAGLRKVMPPAAARSRMATDVGSSHCRPKVMVP